MVQRWPHQQRALDESRINAKNGMINQCIVSPCGGGKTLVMMTIALACAAAGKTVYIYTHRILLTNQIINDFLNAGEDFGVVGAGFSKYYNPSAKIQICSLQTVHRRISGFRWEIPDPDVVIVDEAHQQVAVTATEIFGKHQESGAIRIGFTATPVGIGGLYDALVDGGRYSEMIACNAHVPVECFGPDRPDLSQLKPMASGEFSEADNKRINRVPTIFGSVYDNWRLLNPFENPTVGFAPGCAESQWFVDEFKKKGVPCAHIDADRVVMVARGANGVLQTYEYASSMEARDAVLEGSKNGTFKIVWNRFVMREAINVPEWQHAIAATSMGALSSYLQSIGRILRYHSSMTKACLKRGTPVLTDRGEVPIELVRKEDKVWDGVEFVSHDGAVCNGVRMVTEWCGLVATPDHKVLTQKGWMELQHAKDCGERIVKGRVSGVPERVLDHSNPYHQRLRPNTKCGGQVLGMWERDVEKVPQDGARQPTGLRSLSKAHRTTLSHVDISTSPTPKKAVHRPEGYRLQPLRSIGHRVQVQFDIRSNLLDCGQSRGSEGQDANHRQDRRQGPLRTWKPEVGHSVRAMPKQTQVHHQKFKAKKIPESPPRGWVLQQLHRGDAQRRHDLQRDCGKVEEVQYEEVWDIINAGPRSRYTAGGLIVGNCLQDHGGNIDRHGLPNEDRDWELGDTNATMLKKRKQKISKKKGDDAEPICCPRCNAYRLSGEQCHACGFIHKRSVRMVRQLDGTLTKKIGRTIKYKRDKDFNDYLTEQLFRGVRCDMKLSSALYLAKEAAKAKGVTDFTTKYKLPEKGSSQWQLTVAEYYPGMARKRACKT